MTQKVQCILQCFGVIIHELSYYLLDPETAQQPGAVCR